MPRKAERGMDTPLHPRRPDNFILNVRRQPDLKKRLPAEREGRGTRKVKRGLWYMSRKQS